MSRDQQTEQSSWREAATDAVHDYLRSDPDRCFPTCRVGCPCDGGNEDAATGAGDAAQEIVNIVLGHAPWQWVGSGASETVPDSSLPPSEGPTREIRIMLAPDPTVYVNGEQTAARVDIVLADHQKRRS